MVLLGEVDNLTWGQDTEPILKFEDHTEAGCGGGIQTMYKDTEGRAHNEFSTAFSKSG